MLTTQQLLQQAEALNESEKYQQVIDLLPDSLLEERQSAELYTERARAYGNLKELGNLWYDCEQAIALNAYYFRAYNARGNYWRNKFEYDKAIADYDRAISLKPDYADAFNNRGIAWVNKNEYNKAIADYSFAIALNPDYAIAFNNRGLAWYYNGEYQKAIADYERAIKLNQSYASVFTNRGLVWMHRGQYDKALADYDRAIALNQEDSVALNYRGVAWTLIGKYDKALADYDRAIALNGEDAVVFENRGRAWSNMGEYDKARADYSIAFLLKPNYATAHYVQALKYQLAGNIVSAFYAFEATIEFNPSRTLPQELPSIKPVIDVLIYMPGKNVFTLSAEEITNVLCDFLGALGFELETEDAPIFESYLKRIRFIFSKYLYPGGLAKLMRMGQRALELKHIELPEAEKTERLVSASKTMMETINSYNGEVMLDMGLLIGVKAKINKEYVVVIKSITYHQREWLNKNMSVMKHPKNMYQFLSAE